LQPIHRVILCLFCLTAFWPVVSAQKTDTIVLANGNIVTGEIKRLSLGILDYKTDAAGTISVKWEEVIQIKSPKKFDIRTDEGARYFGSFRFTEEKGVVRIHFVNNSIDVALAKIVEIHPLRRTFWMRLDGSVDVGFNYTKASEVSQLNIGGNTTYWGEKWSSTLSFNSIITTQPDRPQSRKQDATFSALRFLKNQWNIMSILGVEQNTELGLDLRSLFSLGVNNDIIHTKRNYFNAVVGLSVNREWSNGFEAVTNNLESFIGLQFKKFKHVAPKMDISSTILLYPSLSDWGRVRLNLEVKSKFEIVSDLFLSLSFYDNFDNRPATEGAARNDWGVTLSVGYSF
jgi:hypothetical protein